MGADKKRPGDVAKRAAQALRDDRSNTWRRATFVLARPEARAKAREWFDLYPKAAYMTEIEFWRELADGRIEFTIRRLPSAD